MPEDAAAHTIYLADYQPYGFVIDDVQLTFRLNANRTIVQSRIAFRPNPETTNRDFYLDGLDLDLLSATIDGQPVTARIDGGQLRADVPDAPFVWEAEVAINPAANTALEGLYMSGGMYCTQCEAEGFRKITYYPDRPDVMATFTVRIEGDMGAILSNGNPTGRARVGRNGTTRGQSLRTFLRWWPEIWLLIRTSSRPHQDVMLHSTSMSVRATRRNVTMQWMP